MASQPTLYVDGAGGALTATQDRSMSCDMIAGFEIDILDGPISIADEWRQFETHAIATVFQSHAWIDAWCRKAAGAKGETPLIVTARDERGALAFVLPLAVVRRYGTRVLAWIGQSHAGYGAGLYRADVIDRLNGPALRRILQHVAASRPGVTGCILEKQPTEWMGCRNPFVELGRLPSPVAVTAFELKADFNALYEAATSSKKRSDLRRSLKQLQKSAEVEIGMAQSADCRIEAFAAFQAQKTEQLGSLGYENAFANEPISGFYRELLQGRCGDKFEIGYMRVGGEIAAVDIAIRFGNRIYGLNRSMKSGELRRHSPGRLVNNHIVERACKLGCTVYDLGPGDASYKDEWGGDLIELFTTSLAFTAAGLPASIAVAAGARGRVLLKRHERLWGVVQDARRWLRARHHKTAQTGRT